MRRTYVTLVAVFTLVAAADQVTKYLAVAELTGALDDAPTLGARVAAFYARGNLDDDPPEPGKVDLRKPPHELVSGWWHHRYVENPGAAWGLLSRVDGRWRVPFFHLVSLLAIAIILGFYRKLEADQRLMAFALSLVLGGAVGNTIDRLARGYVIDFVDWHWRGRPDLHWPTFNVADAAICVGVFLMLVETLFTKGRVPANSQRAQPGPPAPVPDTRGPGPDTLANPSGPVPGSPGGGAGDTRA